MSAGRARGLAALAVAALAGCAGGAGARRADVTGCYQIERTADARALGLPWGLVLTDEPLAEGWPLVERLDGVRRALTATSATGREDHPFGYWRWSEADSVEVGHPGGGGTPLRLALQGQDLVGVGRAAGDALGPGEAAGPRAALPVVARRVLCGAL